MGAGRVRSAWPAVESVLDARSTHTAPQQGDRHQLLTAAIKRALPPPQFIRRCRIRPCSRFSCPSAGCAWRQPGLALACGVHCWSSCRCNCAAGMAHSVLSLPTLPPVPCTGSTAHPAAATLTRAPTAGGVGGVGCSCC